MASTASKTVRRLISPLGTCLLLASLLLLTALAGSTARAEEFRRLSVAEYRDNLRSGIAPPDSGHPELNKHADDIDYQIEAAYWAEIKLQSR